MPAHALRPLNRHDLRTLSLSALGGALEFYDFIIFVFFAVVIGELFFPPEMPEWLRQLQTYGLFAAGYLARPLGGVVMAHFGDLLGRKKMFTLSIFLMAVPTLLMGLLPTYAQIGHWAPLALLALRILQGAAIGGEVPGAWVFVSEHVPARRVGLACGTLTAGLTFGILLGSLMATAINAYFSAAELRDYAWRVPFIAGGVFGFLAVWLRQWLSETPVFAELKQRQQLAEELPLKTVMRDHWPAVLLSMLLTWLLSAAIVVVILMTPSVLQKHFDLAPIDTLQAGSLAIICLTLGCILFGLAADRFGAGKVFTLGSLLLGGATWLLYHRLGSHPEELYALYALAGSCVGLVGAVPFVLVRAFPAAVRFSGLSFSYNLAYAVFGGLTPMLVAALLSQSRMGPAWYVLALCVLGCLIGLLLWRSERQRDSKTQGHCSPFAVE